jgi:hypothetical protein
VVVCSADGQSEVVTEDCGANGQVCVAASCVAVVCNAGTNYCVGQELRHCSAKGDTYSTSTCGATQYCDAGSNSCLAQICTPNARTCNGTVATTCNANGSGYTAGGTECGPTLICAQGSCQALACVPSARYCDGNTVRQCSADGLSSSLYSTCTASQFCNTTTGACAAQLCSPNQAACDGTVATTCNTEGSGYTGARTDCATTAMPYCADGTCRAGVPCGTTTCPGASCLTSGSSCYYMATTNATTKADGANMCSALGSGWTLCSSTQLCNATVFGYLADQGCLCSADTTACGAVGLSNVYVVVSDYASYAMWTRNLPSPACSGGTPACAESTSSTTGAVMCCH